MARIQSGATAPRLLRRRLRDSSSSSRHPFHASYYYFNNNNNNPARRLLFTVALVVCMAIVALFLYTIDQLWFHSKTAKHYQNSKKRKRNLPITLHPQQFVVAVDRSVPQQQQNDNNMDTNNNIIDTNKDGSGANLRRKVEMLALDTDMDGKTTMEPGSPTKSIISNEIPSDPIEQPNDANQQQQQQQQGPNRSIVDAPKPHRRRRVALDLKNLVVVVGGAGDPDSMAAAATPTTRSSSSSSGTLVLETYEDWAPVGVQRFWELVENNNNHRAPDNTKQQHPESFYTETRFFRVLPNFVAQWGIAADPRTHAQWQHNPIPDEQFTTTDAAASRPSNTQYTVAFATSGADSRTTQLFINLKDNAHLDRERAKTNGNFLFAPIGKIVQGHDTVLPRIYSEYREQPNQGKIVQRGNAYLETEFPLLTYIANVRILPDDDTMGKLPAASVDG